MRFLPSAAYCFGDKVCSKSSPICDHRQPNHAARRRRTGQPLAEVPAAASYRYGPMLLRYTSTPGEAYKYTGFKYTRYLASRPIFKRLHVRSIRNEWTRRTQRPPLRERPPIGWGGDVRLFVFRVPSFPACGLPLLPQSFR